MITSDVVYSKVVHLLEAVRNRQFTDRYEQVFTQLDLVIADFPMETGKLVTEYFPRLYQEQPNGVNFIRFLVASAMKYPAPNLARKLSKFLIQSSSQTINRDLLNDLIETIVHYRLLEYLNLEKKGESIRFQWQSFSLTIPTQNVVLSHRIELLRLAIIKYSRILIPDGPPEASEIQSIIQRLNAAFSEIQNIDKGEIIHVPTLIPLAYLKKLEYSESNSSKLFGTDLAAFDYDERLHSDYSIPLFPLILEDKVSFQGTKIRLQNEGMGYLPPFTVRIVVNEQEFEIGTSEIGVSTNDVREIYVNEPVPLRDFLNSQGVNIATKVVVSFKKFRRTYEYHLLSGPVGAWIEKLPPKSKIDIVQPYEIPLHDLSPKEFERLCLWIVDDYKTESGHKRFREVLWLGESGVGEQGRDIIATEVATGKKFAFQCKRVKDFRLSDLKRELEQFREHLINYPDIRSDVYVLCLSGSVTSDMVRFGNSLSQELGMEFDYWPKSRIDKLVRTNDSIRSRFWQVISDKG